LLTDEEKMMTNNFTHKLEKKTIEEVDITPFVRHQVCHPAWNGGRDRTLDCEGILHHKVIDTQKVLSSTT